MKWILNGNLVVASNAVKQNSEVILVHEICSVRKIKIQTPSFLDSNMMNRRAKRIGIFMENPGNQTSEVPLVEF